MTRVVTDQSLTTDGLIADPDAVVLAILAGIEPGLDAATIHSVIIQAAPNRAQRQRLAHALRADPGLLTSGRPEGPPQVARLIHGLTALGAQRLVLPRCGHCHRPKPLPQRDGALRICAPCYERKVAAGQPCVRCGSTRQVAGRDRNGRPLCPRCISFRDRDPIDEICDRILELDPDKDPEALTAIIRAAVPQQFQRHRVLWELQDRPDLLTGAGAQGSPRINALIAALVAAGVAGVIAPACPSCGRSVRLSHQRDGLRCCRRCYDETQHDVCSRCHRERSVVSRTQSGEALCGSCFRSHTANHEPCTRCGHTRLIVHRDHDQALCRACFRAHVAVCSLCGKEKPCHFASTAAPRCENCSRKLRRIPCSRCGACSPVWSRTQDGQPLCNSCTQRRQQCSGCGKTRQVSARLPTGPLCRTCCGKNPASFRPCDQCGQSERLHHHGLCARCACKRQLLGILAREDGSLRPDLELIYDLLASSEPTRVLTWLKRSDSARVLADLNRHGRSISHEELDRYLPSGAIQHLRKMLVARGVLPDRDECLAQLERWVKETSCQVEEPGERRVLHSFATWHHLRRLRRKSERHRTTPNQAAGVRSEVTAGIKLLAWLRNSGRTLATCSQHDIDRWLSAGGSTRYHARAFVDWAAEHGYSPDLEIPLRVPALTLARIEDDRRWALARRLLHDNTLALEDRVAGLLLLLYAQPLERIARLTRDQIIRDDGTVLLALAAEPLRLDPPVDDLVCVLAEKRHGRAVTGRTSNHPWLFPGGAPGHPISASRLAVRLRALDIQPRAGRNAALMDLAGKLPAVVVSRLLGLHIQSATRWTHRAGQSTDDYAARVMRRKH